ncbi:hypothetical protein [Legionella feeleii]|uniref:Coiled-coil protein n=1 Tax=Legionella feeleii TaxID=453 RepID=A0A0W0TLC3_9GAMM|nr:hypothetical protein [Legionella feeleii]KTC96414.1 hypothetical protein Lfee_2212 [Legionella feeleii]SPX61821.1 Uncharacterised protein [Legionella feeleii]
MSNFFGKDVQRPVYTGKQLQNEITLYKARINEAHQALKRLKQDIDNRCQKLQGIYEFLDQKQALYEQLIARYQSQPSPSLAGRIQKLQKAIEEMLANIETTQPEKVIADLSASYEALQLELGRKEALLTIRELAALSVDLDAEMKPGL